jgi:hypothetical protein
VNIYSGEGKLGTERSRQVQTGSFPPWMSPQDVRADDVGWQRNGSRMNTLEEWLQTHPRWTRWWKREDADGSPNSVQWKSQDLRGECLAMGTTARRPGRPPDHTTCLHNFPQEARLWRERAAKGMDDRR